MTVASLISPLSDVEPDQPPDLHLARRVFGDMVMVTLARSGKRRDNEDRRQPVDAAMSVCRSPAFWPGVARRRSRVSRCSRILLSLSCEKHVRGTGSAGRST